MTFKERIRKYMLSRSQKASSDGGDYPGLNNVKKLAIVFEEGVDDTAPVRAFAKQMKDFGKQVELLAYVPQKREKLEKEPSFPFFTQSETNWYGKPSSEEISRFLDQHYEVFISLNTRKGSPLEFLSAAMDADFSIGLEASGFKDFDLLIKTDNGNAKAALKEIDYYLNFINKKVG